MTTPQFQMMPDAVANRTRAQQGQRHPQLERAKPPSEGYPPIPVVPDGIPEYGDEIRGLDTHGAQEQFRLADVIATAIKLDKHPLVRIEDEAVRSLQPFSQVRKFFEHQDGPGIGRIDVMP